jgi:hypothetical protein
MLLSETFLRHFLPRFPTAISTRVMLAGIRGATWTPRATRSCLRLEQCLERDCPCGPGDCCGSGYGLFRLTA